MKMKNFYIIIVFAVVFGSTIIANATETKTISNTEVYDILKEQSEKYGLELQVKTGGLSAMPKRGELISYLASYLKSNMEIDYGENIFKDVDRQMWQNGLGRMVQIGVAYGDGTGEFRPQDSATLSEAKSFIYRFVCYMKVQQEDAMGKVNRKRCWIAKITEMDGNVYHYTQIWENNKYNTHIVKIDLLSGEYTILPLDDKDVGELISGNGYLYVLKGKGYEKGCDIKKVNPHTYDSEILYTTKFSISLAGYQNGKIFFNSEFEGANRLYSLDVESKEVKMILESNFVPFFYVDGNWIYYAHRLNKEESKYVIGRISTEGVFQENIRILDGYGGDLDIYNDDLYYEWEECVFMVNKYNFRDSEKLVVNFKDEPLKKFTEYGVMKEIYVNENKIYGGTGILYDIKAQECRIGYDDEVVNMNAWIYALYGNEFFYLVGDHQVNDICIVNYETGETRALRYDG